jgi:hypothetical protein
MPGIFISYRRADSPDATGRIYDRLVAEFGRAQVFKDIDSIPLGRHTRRGRSAPPRGRGRFRAHRAGSGTGAEYSGGAGAGGSCADAWCRAAARNAGAGSWITLIQNWNAETQGRN